MFNLLVCYSELSQTMSNHKRSDFDILKAISIVDAKGEIYHLGQNDHVTAVGSDNWSLPFLELLPSLPDLFEEFLLARRKPSLKRSPAPRGEEFDEVIHAHLDQLFDFVATICWFSATLRHVITLGCGEYTDGSNSMWCLESVNLRVVQQLLKTGTSCKGFIVC